MNEQEIADMKSALEAAQASIKALEATNKQLKSEKQTEKKAADEAREAADEAARLAAESSGDIEKIKTSLAATHKKEVDNLTKKLANYETRLSGLLIDNEISKSVAEKGVLPHFVPAVTAMLKAGAKMDGENAVGADGTPLTDVIAAFYASADAKHYVSAPNNTGANATGSTTGATKWSKPPQTAAELHAWDREAEANPAEFNARADSWNRPDLKL